MKKAAIVTLYGNTNFGNKLQNYAVQELLKKQNYMVETIRVYNSMYSNKSNIKNRIRYIIKKMYPKKLYRNKNFKLFEKKYLVNSKKVYFSNNEDNIENKYDIFAIGSDQVWNPNFGNKGKFRFLDSVQNKFSISASFGVDKIEDKYLEEYSKGINSLKNISVRENQGKNIIKDICGREDVEVLIDPTLMLNSEEWDKLVKKPKGLNDKKIILNYFLGELSLERKKEIERIAKENDCQIIDILDKNSIFYNCGPSEFLYLEKNAFLVCTDSFHSCVFAFIYDKPFIIFDREQEKVSKMNSRIETLLEKFGLENRKYENNKITENNLKHNYSEAYKKLNFEREKFRIYLKKAVNIEENSNEN